MVRLALAEGKRKAQEEIKGKRKAQEEIKGKRKAQEEIEVMEEEYSERCSRERQAMLANNDEESNLALFVESQGSPYQLHDMPDAATSGTAARATTAPLRGA